MAGRLKKYGAAGVIGLTLLLVLAVLSDAVPWLRGPAPETSTWYWAYTPAFTGRLLWPLAALLAVFGLGWWWPRAGAARRVEHAGLAALIALLFLSQLALIYADEGAIIAPLVNRTLALNSGGYLHAAGETTDMAALLRGYPAAMPAFASDHPRTHPPGFVLLNWATIQLFDRLPGLATAAAGPVIAQRCTDLWLLARPAAVSAALLFWSFLPLLAAALTPWPALSLARRLGLGRRAARAAALFAATVPALLVFAPAVDQLFPPLVLALLIGVETGLSGGSRRGPLLAGLLLSLLTFLSLGNGALALLLAIYGLLRVVWTRQVSWRALLTTGALTAAGLSSLWLAYSAYSGVPPWAIARVALEQHWLLVNENRAYGTWVVFNLVDLLVYAGPPAIIGLFLLRISPPPGGTKGGQPATQPATDATTDTPRLTSPHGGEEPSSPPPQHPSSPSGDTLLTLALALALTLLLINLSGSLRGEAGRVWLPYLPLLALLGAAGWARRRPRLLPGLLAAQLLLTLSVGLAWEHLRPQILVAAKPAAALAAAPDDGPLAVSFGTVAELRDVAVSLDEAAGRLTVTYRWQATARSQTAYTIFNHLVDSSGQLVAQRDGWSAGGAWPTSCWTPGESIVDEFELDLPADLPPGDYTLYVGLYDAAANTRLPVAGGDAYGAATFTIPAAR